MTPDIHWILGLMVIFLGAAAHSVILVGFGLALMAFAIYATFC